MDAKGKISSFVLNKAMNYISGNPETNIPKLLEIGRASCRERV